MKKVLSLSALMIICSLIIASCSKSNEEEQNPNPDPGPGNGCDTVNMKYAANVLPIIRNNCYSCHGGNGTSGISLDGYNNLKARVDDGRLIGAITHASGFSPMPKGGSKLSDCDINIIKDWIERGAQNN